MMTGDFDTLDGIRSLSMSWVIFGHTFIFALFMWSFTNAYEVLGNNGEGFLATYSAQALTGGYFAVRREWCITNLGAENEGLVLDPVACLQ